MLANLLISLVTFPGVIAHEASHKFFCDWAGVKVLKVCYFRFGNPAGYVLHESANKFSQSFFISVGPFIIGNILAVLFFILSNNNVGTVKGVVFAWLGLAIALNLFPSAGDAKALWDETKRHMWNNPFAIIGLPVSLLIWIISKLNIFYFNYVFAFMLFWFVTAYMKL